MAARKHWRAGFREPATVNQPRRLGFTLIELLVVASMIVLLCTITVPAMSAARRISKRTVCGTNLHSIGQALQAYLSAHNDTYPECPYWPLDTDGRPNWPVDKDGNPTGIVIYQALRTEVSGSREVFRCPADANAMDDPNYRRPTYFEGAGTSYAWEYLFNKKKVGRDVLTSKAHGLGMGAAAARIVFDFKPFHGGAGRNGSWMALYTDFHVQADNYKDPLTTGP